MVKIGGICLENRQTAGGNAWLCGLFQVPSVFKQSKEGQCLIFALVLMTFSHLQHLSSLFPCQNLLNSARIHVLV